MPRPGVEGVSGRVLVSRHDLVVAMLRFEPRATIDEHSAEQVIDVVCLEGGGFTSIDGHVAPLEAGQAVTWPPTLPHRLWIEGTPMLTLMVEHPAT